MQRSSKAAVMESAITLLIAFAVFWLMEGVAWSAHKYLMHGPLWFIHKSHHQPGKHWFELNDLYGLGFAALSVLAIRLGYTGTGFGATVLLGTGIGVAAYGAVYFFVHDVLVHRRIHHRFIPQNGYLQRLYQAHKLHHAVRGRDGCVSFGFVLAPNPGRLANQLRAAKREAAYEGAPEVTADNPYGR